MATAPGALPAAPVGISADQEAQKEYIEALNKQLAALEGRQGYNLFNLAGAFLNPGRTGSFGEALGNAATALGADIERQEARALPIAQMRTQIAAQKFEMQNKEKAYGMVANAMGMGNAGDVARALASGQGLVGLSTKFTPELYFALSRVDPKVAEYVKNAAGMDVERFKAMNEAAKLNVDITKMQQQFGKGAVDYFMQMNGGVLPRGGAAPTGAPAAGGEVPAASSASTAGRFEVQVPSIFGTEIKPTVTTTFKNGHVGVDFAVPSGTPMVAPLNSTVVSTGSDPRSGNYVVIKDSDGNLHTAAHLSEILVKKGQEIPMGTTFGLVGATGNATGPHVHWEIKNAENKPVDPLTYFGISRPTAQQAAAPAAAPAAASATGAQAPAQAAQPTAGGAPQFGYTEVSPGKYRMNYSGREFQASPNDVPERVRDLLAKAVETEQQIYKAAVEAEAKPWQEKQTELMKYDNYATTQNLNRTDGIQKILKNMQNKNSPITGLLQQQDVKDVFMSYVSALGAAAQEGATAGQFGSFSIPVEKFIATATLSREQKAALGELSRLLKQEFFAGMKSNRGVLGVNPTDNDARLYQAAMAGTSDLAENIYSWVQGRAAEYETMNKMYKGYVQHRNQYGAGDPASYFTRETSPYHTAVKDYAGIMSQVMGNAPGVK